MSLLELASKSGRVFELGFKIGFLRGLSESSRFIKLFQYGEVKSVGIEEYMAFLLQRVSEQAHGEAIYRLAQEGLLLKIRQDKKLFASLLPKELNYQEDKEWTVLVSSYVVGWHTGYEFSKDFPIKRRSSGKPVSDLVFFRFGISEELYGEKGVWENADLLFWRLHEGKGELHVYDLKSSGSLRVIRSLWEEDDRPVKLPPVSGYFNLYLSTGRRQESFELFLKTCKELLKDKDISAGLELVNTVQVLSYLFDFLDRTWNRQAFPINEVSFGIINPWYDSSFYKYAVSELKPSWIEGQAEIFKELYKNVNKRFFVNIKAIEEGDTLLLNLDTERIKRKTETIKEKRQRLSQEWLEIVPERSMDDIRREVRAIVEEVKERFFKQGGKLVCALLHSPGAGKTTSIIKAFLEDNKDYPLWLLYIAPRLKLLEQITNRVRMIPGVHVKDVKDIYEEQKRENKKEKSSKAFKVENRAHKIKREEKEGNLNRLKKEVNTENYFDTHRFVFTPITTQSWLENRYGFHTHNHLLSILENTERNGLKRLVVVFDEVLGSENGLAVLKSLMNIVKSSNIDISLFVLDANLHSKEVLQRALEEYSSAHFLAPSLHMVSLENFKERDSFVFEGVNIEVYTGFSFPASKIRYKCDFVEMEEEELFEKVWSYVKESKDKVFIYMQNKELMSKFRDHLLKKGKREGEDFLRFNALSESQKGEDFDYKIAKAKAVIGTSTLSRGVSLGSEFRRTIVVNSEFHVGIENFLVEELQSLARMRGGQDNVEKEIIRIVWFRKKEEDIEEKLALLLGDVPVDSLSSQHKTALENFNLARMEYLKYSSMYAYELLSRNVFLSFIMANIKPKVYVVPLPAQYERVFTTFLLSDIAMLIQAMVSIVKDEKGKEIITEDGKKISISGILIGLLKKLPELSFAEISKDADARIGFALYKGVIRTQLNADIYRSLKAFVRKNWDNIKRLADESGLKESVLELLEKFKGNVPIIELKSDMAFYRYIPAYAFVMDLYPKGFVRRFKKNEYLGKYRIKTSFDLAMTDEKYLCALGYNEGFSFVFPVENIIYGKSYLLGNFPVLPKEFLFEIFEEGF
ncbi:MAG: DEAD/DEAH box helicase family protein [Desulfurococcaceae archaeon]